MPTSYALLSTYPPTQCGLATFSTALLTHLPAPGDSVAVVRVLDDPPACVTDEVVHDPVNGSAGSTATAISILNDFNVVIVQPGLSARMSGHSASLAPELPWPAVASAYRELISTLTKALVGATA